MQDDQLVGKNLGAYHILSLLGQGGMARVYKAYDQRLRRYVAIKTILPQRQENMAEFLNRFIQEAQLVANLHHSNIVTIYEFDETPEMVYLVMQYVAGGTLCDQLKNRQPLAPQLAARYAVQMAHALHHAHQYGIVHRDVKPLNMLISATDRNELLLSDFGIAKLFAHSTNIAPSVDMLTLNLPADINDERALPDTKGIRGSVQYMAPEQCLEAPVDARTDIYALGVVLFEMLTGQLLFQGSAFALMYQHTHTPAPSVHELNQNVPVRLAQITARALEKAPDARYQSAKEMALELESFLSSPVLASNSIVVPFTRVLPPPTTPLPPVIAPPSRPHARKKRRKRSVLIERSIAILFAALVIALILARMGSTPVTPNAIIQNPQPSCVAEQQATNTAKPFVENFQDNQRGWQQGATDAITPKIAHNAYTANIANAHKSYMLCPGLASVGILPQNFTLTATMAQEQGTADAFYGVAFHLKPTPQTSTVSAYVFAINALGTCAVFKYTPDGNSLLLKSLTNVSSIHKSGANTLQVNVQASFFSFKINGLLIPLGTAANQGISDTSYTGGQLGVFVSGPDTTFAITSVQLNIP